ncbi:MAG TPA: discoidin domain-containing protein [Sedimentisphaerales bacterium]|jgi:hypothetical protein|nr:discoidin domain-containing protein [Sedimentisphaerales bacterium]HNU29937.1 discoidin domain-containing protein [Sedimentisphaerales bacterium]
MKRTIQASSLVVSLLISVTTGADRIDLAGTWSVELDRQDRGETQKWFERDLPGKISLPGVLTAQGYGDPPSMQTPWVGNIKQVWFKDPYYKQCQTPGNFKMPFWLQPDRYYAGAAWYQRRIEIPQDWQGKRVLLFLERCHWKTTVWLDGQLIGSNDSLGTPHVYELDAGVKPGRHRLTIRVDNRTIVPVGVDAHSASDHTQGNWNGIVGKIELRATDPVWIDDVRVDPNTADKTATVAISIRNLTQKPGDGTVTVAVAGQGQAASYPVSWSASGREAMCKYKMGDDCELWDEFHPVTYQMTVSLQGDGYADQAIVQFGMRQMGTQGTRITINGKPTFIRGTLECCIFPLTGHPPTDVDSWKRIIRVCKAHGLNHIRFHSWCPPEAAFIAADELGFYYHVECSAWATVGDGGPFDKWLYQESEAMVKAYGNHPSFAMMAYGNEPGGSNQNRFLGDFVSHWKRKDPRRLYTSAAGWPLLAENDYHSTPAPRIQQWGQGVNSRVNAKPPETMTDYSEFVSQHSDAPVISHEIGQWCVFPNFDEMSKYTGLLKPRNFEVFREQLERNGMLHQARDFLMASGKLQTLLYKEEIESALRTPGFGGFQLLDLHDFPGQGTALVGVLDPFWDSKPYVTPEQYHRFCGPTVPLARLQRRIFESGDLLETRIDIAHFGPADLENAEPSWTLRDSTGEIVEEGRFARKTIKTGQLSALGEVRTQLYVARRADKFNLEVTLTCDGSEKDGSGLYSSTKSRSLISLKNGSAKALGARPEFEREKPNNEVFPSQSRPDPPFSGSYTANDWDIWVFPKNEPDQPASDILIATELSDEAIRRLDAGGKVLLLPPPQTIKNDEKHPVQMGFSSIFWNTVWTNWQAPHTLGVLCDPAHPALGQFPTEDHSNWQWWELMHGAAPFLLTEHRDIKPIVQVIDDWVTARKLAVVFEARVGGGRLLACSCDLTNDLDKRPVARQMRRSLLAYMAGGDFLPQFSMTIAQVADLFREPSPLQKLGAAVSADSQHPSHAPDLAIDGNPTTIWHTNWEPAIPMPHYLILDLKQPVRVQGVTYLPRQDMTNGRIGRFELHLSRDGRQWGPPVAAGQWPDDGSLKTIRLDAAVEARFIRLTALSEVRGQPFASAAELDVILE